MATCSGTLMRLDLWKRIFVLMLLACGLTAGTSLLVQQWQFERGFIHYLDQLNSRVVEQGAARLAEYYRSTGSWDALRASRPRFDAVIGGKPEPGPNAGPNSVKREAGEDRPPPPKRDGASRPPPPHEHGEGKPPGPPPEREKGERPGPKFQESPKDGPSFNRPVALMLVDADGVRVQGHREVPENAIRIPVVVDGRQVGEVRFASAPGPDSQIDAEFRQSQRRHALWTAVLSLAASLLFAVLLAGHLRKPIRTLAENVARLSAGEYQLKVAEDRQDELGDLARSFNRLACTLADNQQTRRRWSADLAHELRTPLTILGGELQALLDGIRPVTPDALRSLIAEYQRLMSLVDDLYQLSLSDLGALEYRLLPMDLSPVLRSAYDLHVTLCQTRGLTLSIDLPPGPLMVVGDERRLMQLLHNLLSNAERYTDAPGEVRLSVAEDAGQWRIDVDDSPPGVAPEHLPRLFERLYRVDASRSRQAGGAGLGLSIAHSIVEAHGGRISALPSPLGGLKIRILLPRSNS